MKAVVDANVVVSGFINPHGPPGRVMRLFLDRRAFDWVITSEIAAEYRRSLVYPRVQKTLGLGPEYRTRLERLLKLADWTEDFALPGSVPSDPSDEKYLGAAVSGRAEVVVSGDTDLLQLGRYEGIRIMKPAVFLKELP